MIGEAAWRESDIITQLVRGGLASILVRVAGVALSYAASIVLSRTLGLEAFGAYAIALSWSLVLALPTKAGFDISALRYSSIYLERGHFAALRGFVRVGVATITLLWMALAIIFQLVFPKVVPVEGPLLVWTILLVLPLALLSFLSVVMRTANRVVSAQVYEQVLRPILVICLVWLAVGSGWKFSAVSGMGVTTLAAIAALGALLVEFLWVLRSSRASTPCYAQWRRWISVSIPLLLLGVVQELMNQIDTILLGQLADAKAAALFAASWRIASLVPFALVCLGTVAGPLIARANERRSMDELYRISKLVSRGGFLFALVSAAALSMLGKPLLALYGPEFVAATGVLSILLIGGVANAFTGVVAYFMTLTGREFHALVILAGGLGLSIALNVLLIPTLGARGAAIASSASIVSWNIAMLVYVRRTMGVDASALALPLRAS